MSAMGSWFENEAKLVVNTELSTPAFDLAAGGKKTFFDVAAIRTDENVGTVGDTMTERVAKRIAAVKDAQQDDGAFFVANLAQVGAQWVQWHRCLPRVTPFYAVKCNNDPLLLRTLARLGCHFDCASKGEIDTVLGLPEEVGPDAIIYANPCKTRNYIRHAAANGVSLMTFDNEDELYKVKRLFPDARLVLRIAVSDPSAQCPLNVKFGAEPETDAPRLLEIARELQLNVIGISFHVGSGCRDPSAFAEAIAHSRRLFDFGIDLGHRMHLLDIGGGYPGFPTAEITFEQIADVVNGALEAYFPLEYCPVNADGETVPVRVIAEPGRFFGAAAYTLCCSIMARTRVAASRITNLEADKATKGSMYYINDGVYGSFNCVLYDHFFPTATPLFEGSGAADEVATVWGPTCDGLDRVVEKCHLPSGLQEGDWLRFDNMGAYTMAAGSEFNGFPRPTVHYFIASDSRSLDEQLATDVDAALLLRSADNGSSLVVSSSASSYSSTSGDSE